MDLAFARAFRIACESISEDPVVRTVVICSESPDFCVGGMSLEFASQNFDDMRVASSLAQIKRPVVAALQGAVLDQGLELALAADIRIAGPTTRLAMRQAASGGFPFDGGTQRLTRIAGQALAMEMLLTGRELDVNEAYSRGLVSEIVANPGERAEELATQIAQHGARASEYTSKAVLAAGDMTFEEGARLEAELSFLLHGGAEREEGLAAFREGRKPNMREAAEADIRGEADLP